ncbi:release factor [Trametes meyenii]|nr:release factor [Trametes meyenii]
MYSALRHFACGAISSRPTAVELALRTFGLPRRAVSATNSAIAAGGIGSKSRAQRQHTRTYNTQGVRSNKELALSLQEAISNVERTLESIQEYVDLDRVSEEIQATQTVLEDPQLWVTNPAGAAKAQSRLSDLQHQLSTHGRIRTSLDRLKELSALADKAADTDLRSAILLDIQGLRRGADEYLVSLWLSGTADQNSAYVGIQAESEGAEACDWVATLARMYIKWAHSRNYVVTTVEETHGDVAGTKATTLLIEGRYAYGYAQYESGVHRLDRISSFDKAETRHTACARVRVSPYFEDDSSIPSIELETADLQITTTRSQGAGECRERHVDKTEGAVRVVHVPTGITVSCQQERSRHHNRALALSLLKAKMYDAELQKRAQFAADAHNPHPENSWSSQIRSYTLQPQQLVKDLRTGYYEVGPSAVQDVLDGDLNGLMEASLRKFKKKF